MLCEAPKKASCVGHHCGNRQGILAKYIIHKLLVNYFFWNFLVRDGEEWHRMRQTIGPKIMRPKIVEENMNNFNAVSKDAVARFIKLKETSQEEGHIPDLEKEMKRWGLEGKLKSLSASYPVSQLRTIVNSLSVQVKAKKT